MDLSSGELGPGIPFGGESNLGRDSNSFLSTLGLEGDHGDPSDHPFQGESENPEALGLFRYELFVLVTVTVGIGE